MNQNTVKIMNIEQAGAMRTPLGLSWRRAAGLLKHKQKALIQHIKRVSSEWNRSSK